MKKHGLAGLLAVWLLFCSVPARGGDRYDEWLEQDAHWIASGLEKKRFKQLTTEEEKKAFIEAFWKRRDPTPDTLRNEYKETYYERWEYANRSFREGIPGWRTERGRIYLIHGPPDAEEFRNLPTTGGRGGWRHRQSIVWTYYQMPAARYFKGRMVIVFQPNIGLTEQDLTLGESRVARNQAQNLYNRAGVRMSDLIDMAVRYRLVAAGPPQSLTGRGGDIPTSGIGDYARYVEDLLRPPGELLETASHEDARQERSRAELSEKIETSITYEALPLTLDCRIFHPGERAAVALAWQLPLAALDFELHENIYRARIDFMAQARDGGPQVVDEFFKSVELVYSGEELDEIKGEDFHYLNEFHLPYGDYEISSIARDVVGNRLGSASRRLTLRKPREGQLALSQLVLARSVTRHDGTTSARELTSGDWQFIPESDLEFSPGDRLVLFFRAYNSRAVQGTPRLVINYDFLSDNRLIRTSGPRRVDRYTDPDKRLIAYSSIVDLTDFPSGDYHLQVTAIDFNGRKYAIERAQFQIR